MYHGFFQTIHEYNFEKILRNSMLPSCDDEDVDRRFYDPDHSWVDEAHVLSRRCLDSPFCEASRPKLLNEGLSFRDGSDPEWYLASVFGLF